MPTDRKAQGTSQTNSSAPVSTDTQFGIDHRQTECLSFIAKGMVLFMSIKVLTLYVLIGYNSTQVCHENADLQKGKQATTIEQGYGIMD